MTAAILLGLDIVVILVMLAGFIVSHVGPESVRKQVSEFYAHSIARHVANSR